jgi:hypothetical protein
VRRPVVELAEQLIQPGRAGGRRSDRGAQDAGAGVPGRVDPVHRAILGERGDVRVPARGVVPGTGEQHDRIPGGVRAVGVHPRGRGRRLDIEFLVRLQPQRLADVATIFLPISFLAEPSRLEVTRTSAPRVPLMFSVRATRPPFIAERVE